jgi:quinol monooxygenase YgiN
MADQGISVHVKITINPDHKEVFLAALKPTFEAVKAEPLNTFFEVFHDEKNPGVFKLVEDWNCTAEYIVSVSNENFLSYT